MLAKELAAILLQNPDNYVLVRDVRYSEAIILDIHEVKVSQNREDGETYIDAV